MLGTAVANFHHLEDTAMGWLKITINLLPVAAEVAMGADEMPEYFAKSPERAMQALPSEANAPPPPPPEMAQGASGGGRDGAGGGGW